MGTKYPLVITRVKRVIVPLLRGIGKPYLINVKITVYVVHVGEAKEGLENEL